MPITTSSPFFSTLYKAWTRMLIVLGNCYKAVKQSVFRPCHVSLLTVNSFLEGGAARAAWRHYCGLRQYVPGYADAKFLTLYKTVEDAGVDGLEKTASVIANKLARQDRRLLKHYRQRQRDVFFSPGVLYSPVRKSMARYMPDILHLNWIAGGMMRLEELADMPCPIVWTLHDTWAFTGGCHYVGDCHSFTHQCGHCPVLGSAKANDLSASLMARKSRLYPQLNLTVVTPSHWLAELARQSSLFSQTRVEVIPNGVDTRVFQPLDHAMAKAYFGVPEGRPVILFGSCNLEDPRKGGDLLRAALAQISTPCTLLTFGEGQLELAESPHVLTQSLGRLHDEQSLALAYSAADVFCCPSREDNFPNTVVEAMACGTPCLAFRAGGLPEMIRHQEDGFLAEAYSPDDLAAGMNWFFSHPDPASLRTAARNRAAVDFNLELASQRYHALFEELLKHAHKH